MGRYPAERNGASAAGAPPSVSRRSSSKPNSAARSSRTAKSARPTPRPRAVLCGQTDTASGVTRPRKSRVRSSSGSASRRSLKKCGLSWRPHCKYSGYVSFSKSSCSRSETLSRVTTSRSMSECMGEWAGHMSPRAADPNIQTFTSRSFNRSCRSVQKRERHSRSGTFRPPTPRSVRLASIRVEMAHLAHPPTANLPMFSTVSSFESCSPEERLPSPAALSARPCGSGRVATTSNGSGPASWLATGFWAAFDRSGSAVSSVQSAPVWAVAAGMSSVNSHDALAARRSTSSASRTARNAAGQEARPVGCAPRPSSVPARRSISRPGPWHASIWRCRLRGRSVAPRSPRSSAA
jgi:hypothetical protein